jgi:site-specific recombinase XerD
MSSYKNSVKSSTPVLQSTRVLDQLRKRIRYMHYSLSTEKVYVCWVRFFIRWSGHGGAMRHPREMGASEVEAFLTHLATDRKVSASTHNQALSAILFHYREVLAIELPWLNGVNRPTQKRRIPSVLTKDEVAGLLAQMDGETALIARLLYGTGMRLMEGMRLRIKDVDFDRQVIIVTGRAIDYSILAGRHMHPRPLPRIPLTPQRALNLRRQLQQQAVIRLPCLRLNAQR